MSDDFIDNKLLSNDFIDNELLNNDFIGSKIMDYNQAQAYLTASYEKGKKKGHDKMKAALEILGNPQNNLKIIHAAGTNGKGSFCAMLGSILQKAGFKIGFYSSPHLELINERFTINGQLISDWDFAKCMSKIAHVDKLLFNDSGFSYFEILTLLAFVYFNESAVDILLLEVGIGGRLDATNVLESPLLSVIMSIGMDHMDILGNSIEQIAKEKAGIIKKDCPLALYPNTNAADGIIKQIAIENNAKIYHAADINISNARFGIDGTKFTASHASFGNIEISLSLIGRYQLQNAATCMAAVIALNDLGYSISPKHMQMGFCDVYWPGRMEIIDTHPTIVLEGAHNKEGAMAAAKNIQELFKDKEITLVMGILDDKEYEDIVRILAAGCNKIIFTKPIYDFRAVPPHDLAVALKGINAEMIVEENCHSAIEIAKSITIEDGIIFCTGSLYLIGDIRKYVKQPSPV